MSSWTGVFQFGTFLSVVQRESRCIFALGLSSILCNSFSMLFIYLTFQLCSLRSHILLQNYFGSFQSGYCYVFVHSPPTSGWIFCRCFGRSCFVGIVWSCLRIFSVFFLSPVHSDFLRVVLFALFVVLLFAFPPNIFHRRFLIWVSSLISRQGFEFLIALFRRTLFIIIIILLH